MRVSLRGQAMRRGRRRAAAVALAMLVALAAAALVRQGSASAASETCNARPCVVLIQVDGLEPKDVTPATTPYLWSLAHPPGQLAQGGLVNRSGWIWQAPRGIVSTGTGSATASLLTGAYPEKTGIPADDFDGEDGRVRLGAEAFGDDALDQARPLGAPKVDTLITAAPSADVETAVFLGDPALANIAVQDAATFWFPPGSHPGEDTSSQADARFTGDPRLCPIPRYPSGEFDDPPSPAEGAPCPANDQTTLQKAITDLQADARGAELIFIELAELGVVKRQSGDTDVNPDNTPPQTAKALENMDTAIGSFVEQFAQNLPEKWPNTVVMVAGSHGYQTIPASRRVLDPAPDNVGVEGQPSPAPLPYRDLSDYVSRESNRQLTLIPQGTMATINYTGAGAAADRSAALETMKRDLERSGEAAESVNGVCRSLAPELGDCIADVEYVNPADSSGNVDRLHPTWHFDAKDPDSGVRTGASGDLVVLLNPGWAVGRAVPDPQEVAAAEPRPVSNPYNASSGAPSERAVAALINGPSLASHPGAVRSLDQLPGLEVPYYPVSRSSVDPSDHNNPPLVDEDDVACPSTPQDFGGIACANNPTEVDDDPDDPGHEAQPVIVDFALTVSALMQIPFESRPDQTQGRVLQEAFLNQIQPPCVDCVEPEPPICGDTGAFTLEGEPVAVPLRCFDDVSGDLLSSGYEIVSAPAHGTLGAVEGDTVTYTPAPGFSGVDEFTYRARDDAGPAEEVGTAAITIQPKPIIETERPPEFDFHGLIRDLSVRVVDSRNRPYDEARRGARMSSIRLEADFGKPEAAVSLTFYRRTSARSRGSRRERGVPRAVRTWCRALNRYRAHVRADRPTTAEMRSDARTRKRLVERRGFDCEAGGADRRARHSQNERRMPREVREACRKLNWYRAQVRARRPTTAESRRNARARKQLIERRGFECEKRRSRGRGRRVRLKAIARFDPFVVRRGHVTIRLRVPRKFKPTYVGLTVREITRNPRASQRPRPVPCTKTKPRRPVRFMCVGPKAGSVSRVADARRLHTRKGRSERRQDRGDRRTRDRGGRRPDRG